MSIPVTAAARVSPILPAGSPRIIGVVNITEDSFSDGGCYLDPEAAIIHARKLRPTAPMSSNWVPPPVIRVPRR